MDISSVFLIVHFSDLLSVNWILLEDVVWTTELHFTLIALSWLQKGFLQSNIEKANNWTAFVAGWCLVKLKWTSYKMQVWAEIRKRISTRMKEDFVWFFSPSVVSIFVTVKACLRKFILLWILLDADFNLSPAKTKRFTSYFDVVETRQILPGNCKMY